MNTVMKLASATFLGAALMSTQAIAASGALSALDAWEHTQEGHMAAESGIKLDTLRSAGGGNVEDAWGVEINSN